MHAPTQHIVNLDLPPSKRWTFLENYRTEMNALLRYYLNDFEAFSDYFYLIEDYKKNFISENYLAEIEYIASISDFNANEIMVTNLYYDVLKFYFGCTAFATHRNDTIYHARNLDWHTENNLLSKHTMIFDFQKAGKSLYKVVGWPGFVGALSGTKTGSFSITLNAVLSEDSGQLSYPVSFLIRDVLEQETTFDQALQRLSETEIICDCLLLLSGVKASEMAVIERTPGRFAIRRANQDSIVVTNDYKKLEASTKTNDQNQLQSTSCGRFDQATLLLNTRHVGMLEDCLDILKDENVMMNITVQQMVFDNLYGGLLVIKT